MRCNLWVKRVGLIHRLEVGGLGEERIKNFSQISGVSSEEKD